MRSTNVIFVQFEGLTAGGEILCAGFQDVHIWTRLLAAVAHQEFIVIFVLENTVWRHGIVLPSLG